MIDLIALVVPHFAMAVAVWRLVRRADLDRDPVLTRIAADADHQP
jgi:hypothetical protein